MMVCIRQRCNGKSNKIKKSIQKLETGLNKGISALNARAEATNIKILRKKDELSRRRRQEEEEKEGDK